MDLDRRRAARYPMSVPIRIGSIEGKTRDVSTSGVFFRASAPFEIGDSLRFTIQMDDGFGGVVEIDCEGVVARVDRAPTIGQRGVAATIDRFLIGH